MESQIVYSFLLYMAFVIFPLIPAYIIYKKFPDTQVGANGLLGNLKINATGAFAAYLITCVLGFYIIRSIQGNIMNTYYQTWEVNTVIRYKDSNGHLMPSQDNYVKLTNINVNPFIKNKDESFVSFLVTGKGKDIIVSFNYNSKGFITKSYSFSKADKNVVIDEVNRRISIDTVFIIETAKEHRYNDTIGTINAGSYGPAPQTLP